MRSKPGLRSVSLNTVLGPQEDRGGICPPGPIISLQQCEVVGKLRCPGASRSTAKSIVSPV